MDSYKSLSSKAKLSQKLLICLLTMIMVSGCVENKQIAIDAAISSTQQFDADKQAREDANDKRIQAEAVINSDPKAAAQAKVDINWLRPPIAAKGLKCTVQAKLMSDGTVVSAEIISSSGDEIFDRSAEKAVEKASPLPVSNDKEVFAQEFRSLTLTFAEQVKVINKAQDARNNADIQATNNEAQNIAQKHDEALALKEYDRQLKSGRYPFVAELSCTVGGKLAYHPSACFHPDMYSGGTTFEIKNGDSYKMYQYYDLGKDGIAIDRVLHIPLEQSFSITTQNSDTFALLNLKIKDTSTGKIIFEKSVGHYRIISVKN